MAESIRKRKEPEDISGLNREIPYAGFIHMDVEIEDGRPLTILRKDTGNIGNPFVPMIHGGAVGALLEHAALMQLLFELELGLDRRPKIVNISIDYLRPCLLEDTFARGGHHPPGAPGRQRAGRSVAVGPRQAGRGRARPLPAAGRLMPGRRYAAAATAPGKDAPRIRLRSTPSRSPDS